MFVSSVPLLSVVSCARLTQKVGPWLIVTLLRRHEKDARDVCDATGAMSNCPCASSASAVHHSCDRTRTVVVAAVQLEGCVEQKVDVPVSQSAEQIVDDSMSQVVTDTVVEQIVDMPVLQFQARFTEHNVDSTHPSIKEEVVDVIQPLPQDCIQGRLAEQMVKLAVPTRKQKLAEASTSGAHPRPGCRADSGTPHAAEKCENRGTHSLARGADGGVPSATDQGALVSRAHPRGVLDATDQGETRGGVSSCDSGAHPRAWPPKKCRRRKRQKGQTWP